MHNEGKVDRKYLREVSGAAFKLGEKPVITKDYLRDSIRVLLGLSAITTQLALKNNYDASAISRKFRAKIYLFDKEYKGK